MTRILTRLTVVAHASTPALRQAAFPADEPIDSYGERDCAGLALGWRPAQVYIAPELRARQTAEALGLAGETVPDLCDCDYGLWTGKSVRDVSDADPEGFARWLADPLAAPHGGESFGAVLNRIATWFDATGVQPSHSVVVAHPITVRAAIVHVLGAGAGAFQSVDVWPLGAADFTGSTRWHFRSLARLGSVD